MFIFLVSLPPGGVDPWQCTSEKGKEAPGEKLPALTPVPDGVEFGQRHEPVNTNYFSSARTPKRFPSSGCASAIQIVRQQESTVETQPKL